MSAIRKSLRLLAIGVVLLRSPLDLAAQDTTKAPKPAVAAPAASKPWFERLSVRGYAQVRYNRLLETNPDLQCEQCDRSWGTNGGIFLRRARLIISGQVSPRVYVYLQPDFATAVGTTGNIAQMRDWYADIGLDPKNEFRVRLGQSKVPYSFENMQSSSQRLPLDRADATNTANANERDLGAYLLWAPTKIRDRFKALVNDGRKGSGDYGVVALGVFNGQTANRPEANNGQHVLARVSYPFMLGRQIVEPGVAAYTGRYVVTPDQRSAGVKGTADWNYDDQRMLASLSIAPAPFGLLAEYNVGRGPEFNPVTDSIETRQLRGGFVTATYRVMARTQQFAPFVRYQVYEGGKKHERDARSQSVNDVEVGLEWQPNASLELVGEMYWGDRRFEDFQRQENRQKGRLFRLQVQVNY